MRISDWSSDVCSSDLFYEGCSNADLVIIANNHPVFSKIEFNKVVNKMNDGGFVYDYWNNLEQYPPEILSNRYFAVGNQIGRASCRERVCQKCRSRWSPCH